MLNWNKIIEYIKIYENNIYYYINLLFYIIINVLLICQIIWINLATCSSTIEGYASLTSCPNSFT